MHFGSYSHPTGLEDIDLGDILDCSEHFESAPYEVDESSDDTLDKEETVETTKFIAFESCFRQLIEDIPIPTCTQSNCKAKPTPEFKFIGTALSVKWVNSCCFFILTVFISKYTAPVSSCLRKMIDFQT